MTNSGDTDSDSQSVQVDTPDGVSLSGGSGEVSPNAPALRRFSAFLAPAATDGGASGADPVRCGDGQCRYTVPANSTLTVTMQLTITPAAADGDVTLTVPGAESVSLPMSVASALTSFRLGKNDWAAGTTVPGVPLTADVAPGVTTIGAVTLQLQNGAEGDLWITDYPDTCTPAGTRAITCTGSLSSDGKSASFGDFSITPMPTANGAQEILASLPGGRSAQIFGGDGRTIDASPLEAGAPISMEGRFGGTIIGAPTLYCPGTDRSECQGGTERQDTPCKSETNPKCSYMREFRSPITRTLPVPAGATLVSAQLTWAMSTWADPDNPVPADANSVNLVLDEQPCAAPTHGGKCVVGTPVRAPAPIGKSIQCPGISPCPDTEVAQWVADITGLVRGHHSIGVTDLDAPRQGTSRTPMGAWALTLIWSLSDPDAPTTTVRTLTPLQAIAGDGGTWSCDLTLPECASDTRQVQSVAVALWGVDDLPDKTISIGDDESVLARFRSPSDQGGPRLAGLMANQGPNSPPPGDWLATGLDIVQITIDRALSGPLMVEAPKSDLVWVGVTLAIRKAD